MKFLFLNNSAVFFPNEKIFLLLSLILDFFICSFISKAFFSVKILFNVSGRNSPIFSSITSVFLCSVFFDFLLFSEQKVCSNCFSSLILLLSPVLSEGSIFSSFTLKLLGLLLKLFSFDFAL